MGDVVRSGTYDELPDVHDADVFVVTAPPDKAGLYLSPGVEEWRSNGGSQTFVRPSGGDDAAALVAALPDLGLRVGTYLAASGVSVAQQSIVEGRGMGAYQLGTSTITDALSTISVSSATDYGLDVSASGCYVTKLGVKCTASPPTAAAGLRFNGAHGFRLRDVSSRGFYNGIRVASSSEWIIDGAQVMDAVNYGIYITGTDDGDGVIQNSFINAGPNNNGAAAIRWEGGGGVSINHVKTNRVGPLTHFWTNALDIVSKVDSGEINVSDSVFDAYSGKGVNIDTSTMQLSNCNFDDVKLRSNGNPSYGYYLRGAAGGKQINQVAIQGGEIEMGTNCLAAIDADYVNNLTIDNVAIRGVPATSPLIRLGSNVFNAKLRLGAIGAPGSTSTHSYASGTQAWLLAMAQQQNNGWTGAGNEFVFSWQMPSLSDTTTWKDLWLISGQTMPLIVELNVFYTSVTGTGAHRGAFTQKRLIGYPSGPVYTTYGTDTGTDPDLDVNWTNDGSGGVKIQVRLKSGTVVTAADGYSQIRVIGVPANLYAFN